MLTTPDDSAQVEWEAMSQPWPTMSAPTAAGVHLAAVSPDHPVAILHRPRKGAPTLHGQVVRAAAMRREPDADDYALVNGEFFMSRRSIDEIEAAQHKAAATVAADAAALRSMLPEPCEIPCQATMVTDDPAAANDTGNRHPPPTLLALTTTVLTAAPPRPALARTTHPA